MIDGNADDYRKGLEIILKACEKHHLEVECIESWARHLSDACEIGAGMSTPQDCAARACYDWDV